ncbi:MAG: 2-oxo acid dehydrogenase subunit E2 [Pirellula sp.]|nr:2-oxo acid dehydrogenase subunit E2 [Pirellula sp.]
MTMVSPSRDRGSRRWLPNHRRMAVDIANAAKHVPSFPVHRRMQLGQVETIRRNMPDRIGWAALLTHTYSRLSERIPELRDIYVSKPVPYLYRHPHPIASITVHRTDDQGNERLVWGRIGNAHRMTPEETQKSIASLSLDPIESFFRDGLKMERRIGPIRAMTWSLLMQWCGRRRAKHLGTFSISNLGGWGALNAHHPLVTATSLSMGPIQKCGECDVVLLCDHRVLDGALAAKVLLDLEYSLTAIADWLQRYSQEAKIRQAG